MMDCVVCLLQWGHERHTPESGVGGCIYDNARVWDAASGHKDMCICVKGGEFMPSPKIWAANGRHEDVVRLCQAWEAMIEWKRSVRGEMGS